MVQRRGLFIHIGNHLHAEESQLRATVATFNDRRYRVKMIAGVNERQVDGT